MRESDRGFIFRRIGWRRGDGSAPSCNPIPDSRFPLPLILFPIPSTSHPLPDSLFPLPLPSSSTSLPSPLFPHPSIKIRFVSTFVNSFSRASGCDLRAFAILRLSPFNFFSKSDYTRFAVSLNSVSWSITLPIYSGKIEKGADQPNWLSGKGLQLIEKKLTISLVKVERLITLMVPSGAAEFYDQRHSSLTFDKLSADSQVRS